jgi:hypothetical protein
MNGGKWAAARRKAHRALAAISDKEDAAIRKAAAADPDNPPIDDRQFAAARPSMEVATGPVRRARRQRGLHLSDDD